MFSLYQLKRHQKLILSTLVIIIVYQVSILTSAIYHSEKIIIEIDKFKQINRDIQITITEKQKQYIRSILPSMQELMRKENFGEVIKGERVFIIQNSQQAGLSDNLNKTSSGNIAGLNFPERWILFLTGINPSKSNTNDQIPNNESNL